MGSLLSAGQGTSRENLQFSPSHRKKINPLGRGQPTICSAERRADVTGGQPLGCRQPVPGIKGAAHSQRQWGHIQQLVGRHLLARFRHHADVRNDFGRWECATCLVRPFCLAGVCRTGYRKE